MIVLGSTMDAFCVLYSDPAKHMLMFIAIVIGVSVPDFNDENAHWEAKWMRWYLLVFHFLMFFATVIRWLSELEDDKCTNMLTSKWDIVLLMYTIVTVVLIC